MTTQWLPIIRDAVQILFFLAIGAITLLTYRHARRTVLQPIRTEVFKEQVKYFGQLRDFLTGKYVGEVNEVFPVDSLIDCNTWRLFDDYAEIQLHATVDREDRPYEAKHCRNFVVPAHLLEPIGPYKTRKREVPASVPDWKSYRFEGVAVPRPFFEQHERVRAFIRSPLAPKKLVALLEELEKALHHAEASVAGVLTACSKDLPAMYPSLEKLNEASFAWVQGRHRDQLKPIEPLVERIVDYIRSYFATDTLLGSGV